MEALGSKQVLSPAVVLLCAAAWGIWRPQLGGSSSHVHSGLMAQLWSTPGGAQCPRSQHQLAKPFRLLAVFWGGHVPEMRAACFASGEIQCPAAAVEAEPCHDEMTITYLKVQTCNLCLGSIF